MCKVFTTKVIVDMIVKNHKNGKEQEADLLIKMFFLLLGGRYLVDI